MKAADRYAKIVEWSPKDGCFVGSCPGLALGGVHGSDERKVYSELCAMVDEWIRILARDQAPLPPPTSGRSFSGKFVLRVGKSLHRLLTLQATREGDSLNAFCTRKLSGAVAGKGRKRTRRTG